MLVNQFERRIQDMTKEMGEMKEQFEQVPAKPYSGISRIRNSPPLGPYSRPIPRALW